MIEKKQIELKYGKRGWAFHIINDIEDLLEKYGMGDIKVINDTMYFEYDDGDDIIELVKKYLGEPFKEDDTQMHWICSTWIPASFDIIWYKEKGYGLSYFGDFKFKTIQDFNVFVREVYKYKRQNKANTELRKKQNMKHDYGFFIAYNVSQFALTYCDYTNEEREKIEKYWADVNKEFSNIIVPIINDDELIFEENKNASIS